MRVYEIKPLVSIGPVEIGMSRLAVRKAMQSPVTPFRKTPDSKWETDAFDERGFHVYYSGDEPMVEFIELFHHDKMRFLYKGVDVFRTPASDLLKLVSAESPAIEEDPNCCYVFPDIELSLWRSCPPEVDEPDRFEALGAGRRGYFSEQNS